MSTAVSKLEALLSRVQRNRAKPRVADAIEASPLSAETAPVVAEKPVVAPPAPVVTDRPVVAPPAPVAKAELSPEALPEASLDIELSMDEPISEVRDLPEPPAAERKKPAPSPLELAVESSAAAVEEIELPTATAAIPDSYRHEPAAAMSAEPERLAAPDVTVSSPVATVASPFVAAKPATFGELLDRTLHLKIR